MNNQKTSPAKCAAAKRTKEITITIKGKAYKRLELLAKSLHEWNPQEYDVTPRDIFNIFFSFDIGMLLANNPSDAIENVAESVSCLLDTTTEARVRERDRLYEIMNRNLGVKEVA